MNTPVAEQPDQHDATALTPAPWMKTALNAAAIYNLVWGAVAIFAPLWIFRIAGVQPVPLYPEIWQCLGMVVGVYGIGYAIAARNPLIHWPIVLVGLLGKVFGPIGFAIALSKERFPLTFGWTIVTNDLIWWIPFGLILWQAARYHQAKVEQLTVRAPVRKINPMGRMMSQRGATLAELSRRSPVLVVFLRHSGCTFCREAVSDIADQRSQIEAQGTQIAFVHMGQTEPVDLLKKHGLSDLHCFRDPVCSLYDAFGLKMGSFRQLLGPRVWWRALMARVRGIRSGGFDGNVFRMPGVFLLVDGEVARSYRHASAADRPDYVHLAKAPGGQPTPPPRDPAPVV